MALANPLPTSSNSSESGAPWLWPVKASLAPFSQEASLLFCIWGVYAPHVGVIWTMTALLVHPRALGVISEDGCGGQTWGEMGPCAPEK